MRNLLSVVFLVIGISMVFGSAFVLWRRNDPNRLRFKSANMEGVITSWQEKEVLRVSIKELDIDLPVVLAEKDGDRWETTSKGVSYLAESPLPGEIGNSIMYGHNWGSILGNLHKARPGQEIEIYYSDGSEAKFKVMGVVEVSPLDSSVLSQTREKRLTIYTCSGLFDQKRLVVSAFLI